jgi:hypothetical protein
MSDNNETNTDVVTTSSDLLNYIKQGKHTKANVAFNELMAQRVSDAVEQGKEQFAATVFDNIDNDESSVLDLDIPDDEIEAAIAADDAEEAEQAAEVEEVE